MALTAPSYNDDRGEDLMTRVGAASGGPQLTLFSSFSSFAFFLFSFAFFFSRHVLSHVTHVFGSLFLFLSSGLRLYSLSGDSGSLS